MTRVAALFAMVVGACSGKAAPAPPAPATATATAADAGAVAMDACQDDRDCEIHAECCAYCFDNTITVSLNKAYSAYGALLTLTFYCPMCAEGGCTRSPPKRTPICKQGRCARRDVWTDEAGKVTSIELPNDPKHLVLDPGREIVVTALQRLCERAVACNVSGAGGCDQLRVPQNFACAAARQCYDAIDRMSCPTRFDIFAGLNDVAKLPACAKLDRLCPATP